MTGKACAVCGREVYKNTGTFFNGMLVHKWCVGRAEATWYLPRRRKIEKNKKQSESMGWLKKTLALGLILLTIFLFLTFPVFFVTGVLLASAVWILLYCAHAHLTR